MTVLTLQPETHTHSSMHAQTYDVLRQHYNIKVALTTDSLDQRINQNNNRVTS